MIAPLGRPRSTIVRKVFPHSPHVQQVILQPALAPQAEMLHDRKTTVLYLYAIM